MGHKELAVFLRGTLNFLSSSFEELLGASQASGLSSEQSWGLETSKQGLAVQGRAGGTPRVPCSLQEVAAGEVKGTGW